MGTVHDLYKRIYGYKTDEININGLRFWHLESMLNQAADLLDRCIRDRAEYYQLSISQALLDLEIQQAEQDDAILRNELKKGLYNYPENATEQVDNDLNDPKSYEAWLNDTVNRMDDVFKLTRKVINQIRKWLLITWP